MTTDAPAALFWLLAVITAYLAVVQEKRACWIPFGIFVGAGALAKYTVLALYPSVFLFLWFTPSLRPQLRSSAFILGLLGCIVVMLPILIWNAEHGWVNFAHNAGHVVKTSGLSLHPGYFVELILGQLGLAGPILFGGLAAALYQCFLLWRRGDQAAGILAFSALPLAAFITLVSFSKRIYANWPMPVYLSAALAAAHYFSVHRSVAAPQTRKWIHRGIALSAALTLLAHLPFLGVPVGVSGKLLQTKKLYGWDDLARRVDEQLSEPEMKNGRMFLLSDEYETLSEISFYSSLHPDGYCAVVDSRRMNQYDIWGGFEKLAGKDALIVLRSPERIEPLRSRFQSIEPLGPHPNVEFNYQGSLIKSFYFFRGRGYNGSSFPLPESR